MVTFVSLMPRPISEEMPHIIPSQFNLDAAKDKDFEILYINNAVDNVYAGDGKHIQRPVFASEVAENLKNMVCNSQLCIGDNASPGVFWVEGELTKEEVTKKCLKQLANARMRQMNWYRNLLNDADDVWSKFHQHRMISGLHRFAATALNKNREWAESFDDVEAVDCPACGTELPNPNVTICATCHTIIKPKEHAEKFSAPKEVIKESAKETVKA